MDKEYMITTIDNPYNPFEDFDNWYMFDIDKGYYTCDTLARLIDYKNIITDVDKEKERIKAIDRLIEIDPLAIYKKIYKK